MARIVQAVNRVSENKGGSHQWDPKKAASNLNKHGVDFADAVGVFEDEWVLTLKEEYVEDEQRCDDRDGLSGACVGGGLHVSG